MHIIDTSSGKQPQSLLSADHDWVLQSSVRAVWMGEMAWEGHWRSPSGDISDAQLSLFDAIERDVKRRLGQITSIRKHDMQTPALTGDCLVACHKYSVQPYSLSASLQGSAGGSGVSSLKRQSYRTGIEEASCAPSVAFVGFMASAVSVIHALLVSHPQALPAMGAGVSNPFSRSPKRFSCYRTHFGRW